MTDATADDILTVSDAAAILGKSYMATQALLRRGSIRGRKVGRPGIWVTTRFEVIEYMAWARTHGHHDRRRFLTGRYVESV